MGSPGTGNNTTYDEYLDCDATTLRSRYLRVMATIADLHLELAMVRTQERRAKTETWLQSVQQGSTQREADKFSDRNALEATTEVWNVMAEMEAATCERDVLLLLMGTGTA